MKLSGIVGTLVASSILLTAPAYAESVRAASPASVQPVRAKLLKRSAQNVATTSNDADTLLGLLVAVPIVATAVVIGVKKKDSPVPISPGV
ncbi:hypothetical protein J2792_003297 [Novosphingobium capsulatum]|uniref:Uncharacterized protein n=1 Tax=Novosphingobium capsulatum TaxID=13688 RepID=A0ABU1MPZ1_9SPHN|nr:MULTISPECIES: hypothetical protein [Novosphingobium]MDR6512414.1 hypothetical protein [Novosphingobium capsulatum]PTR09779.1 hypothetical protein C8K11_10870 [Novosphingobium sp. GV055]PUB02566.1 hypothetical protein C8K12_10870 [Novosphingobium sp. GV061]PUB19511.1 hypothetical protein C8K14_10870 [Novosphingobium sp. GV079]PUB40935.1 hypothetical protein C8K10_10870 [Novosphingobium sp. GV027]